jgi:cyclic pyranopterin phosphate synthase
MIDLIASPTEPRLADAFHRAITYLRISVTDRCNLRCTYCMPEQGLPWIDKADVLTYEEITEIVRAAAKVGVKSIRLTGGEPLIRYELDRLVAMIAAVPGIEDIALSTNGLMLADQARALKAAGLTRANISLDTLRKDRFEKIARRPGLHRVIEGIDAAFNAGLGPIKLNCVVMRGQNDDEVADFAEMTRKRAVHVRFIEVMPVQENVSAHAGEYISAAEILDRIRAIGDLRPVDGPPGNGPARYYAFDGALGSVGVISPLSHDYCDTCNRVRLSADGRLKLCLFGDHFIDLRTPVRDRAGEDALISILRGSMYVKPERHHLDIGTTASAMRALSEIGG